MAAGPRQRSHSRSETRWTQDHILLSHIRDFNKPGELDPCIYIPPGLGGPFTPLSILFRFH
jgi:hypothetical protein